MQVDFKTRRDFLRTTVLGGALTWTVPTFLAHTWCALAAETTSTGTVASAKDAPILIVLQLAGGNDGLNTVVPFGNDEYYRARARLALPAKDLLRINETLAFPPALKGFQALFEAGHLAVIQGVGYPNPNRSHFRSMEIWQTASDANRVERHGWLGRYFDNACAGCDPTMAVNVGRQMPQAFAAQRPAGISVNGPRRSERTPGAARSMVEDTMKGGDHEDAGSGATIGNLSGPSSGSAPLLDFLDRTALDARVSSAQVADITRRTKNLVGYPGTNLAQSLRLVAQLIGGGLPARIYYLSQGGYDTHSAQMPQHARLLQELGDGMKAFVDDLKAQGNLGRVLVMAFSEFGRRVAENASGGTDHGAAGPMFLFGEKFASPLLGHHPSLAPADQVNGDLRFGIDFRSVYAAVLDDWLQTSSERILGGRFERLKLR